VPLGAEAAYRLFTPEGERAWADGWSPAYPLEGAYADDTAPGTVFQTGHGHVVTTWIVLDRTPGSLVRYARVTPGSRAGTVSVSLFALSSSACEVTVSYALTALSDAGRAELTSFAAGYEAFLESWRTAIAASLDG
jgi:hypothetical protein